MTRSRSAKSMVDLKKILKCKMPFFQVKNRLADVGKR